MGSSVSVKRIHVAEMKKNGAVRPTRMNKREIDLARAAFKEFDKDKSGSIDQKDLKALFKDMRIHLTDTDIFQMISVIDEGNSGAIDMQEFLRVTEENKVPESRGEYGAEISDAYVACGGNADETGFVNRHVIGKLIEGGTDLEVDINRMVDDADKDRSGEMEFGEFKDLLNGDADVF